MDLDEAARDARPGLIPSAMAAERGVVSDPILVFMDVPAFAALISLASTLSSYWCRSRAEALAALEAQAFCAILGMSPAADPGSAGDVIRRFRERNPGGLAVYHGWDYRIEVSGPRALECQADALILGGVELNEFLAFLFHTLQAKQTGVLPAPSLETYRALLEERCPRSGFWKGAEILRSGGRPPSAYW